MGLLFCLVLVPAFCNADVSLRENVSCCIHILGCFLTDTVKHGIIEIGDDGCVTQFLEKPHPNTTKSRNAVRHMCMHAFRCIVSLCVWYHSNQQLLLLTYFPYLFAVSLCICVHQHQSRTYTTLPWGEEGRQCESDLLYTLSNTFLPWRMRPLLNEMHQAILSTTCTESRLCSWEVYYYHWMHVLSDYAFPILGKKC